MRPVAWSSSYLFRWPFGISIVTSNCTAVVWPTGTPSNRRRVPVGGGQHLVERFDGRLSELLEVPAADDPPRGGRGRPARGRGRDALRRPEGRRRDAGGRSGRVRAAARPRRPDPGAGLPGLGRPRAGPAGPGGRADPAAVRAGA